MAPKLNLRQKQLQSRLREVEDNFIRSYGVRPSNKNKDDDYERNAKLLNELRDKAYKMGVPYRSNKEIVSASKEYREDKLRRGARAGYQEGVYNPKTKTREYASPIDQTGNTYNMWDNRGGRKTILNNPVMDAADIAAIIAGVGIGLKASIALAKNPSLIYTYPMGIQKKILSAFSNIKGNKKMASNPKKAGATSIAATVGKLVGSKLNQKTYEKFKNFPDAVKKKLGPKIKEGDFSGPNGASKMQTLVDSPKFQIALGNTKRNLGDGPVSTVRPGLGPRVSNTSKVKNTTTSSNTTLGPVKDKTAWAKNKTTTPPKVNTGNFSTEVKPFINKRAAGSILTIGGLALLADNYGEKIANYWENYEFPADKSRRLRKEKELNKLLEDAVGEQGMMGGMGEPNGGKPEKTKTSSKPANKKPVNKKPVNKQPVVKKNKSNPVETYEPKKDKTVDKKVDKKPVKKDPPKKKGRFEQGRKEYKTPFGTLTVDSTDRGMSKFGLSDNWKELEEEEEMNFRRGGMPRSKAKPFGMGGMYKAPKKKYTAGLNMRYGGATKRSKGY